MMMTLHQTFFEWSQWFWPLLANHLWQTTLIAFIAWGLVSLLKRATARARYLIWMIAFVKFLVISPLLIIALESCGLDISKPSTYTGVETFFQIAQLGALPGFDSESVRIGATSVIASPAGHAVHSELYCLLTIVWFLGSGTLFARWMTLRRRFARAMKTGSEITRGPAAVALQRVRKRLSLKSEIGLIKSPRICGPGVWGIWRPVVFFPKGLADKLSAEELETVMMHELIHVSRRDNLLGTLQMLICCLFWFHPSVWLIDRRLLAEREMICDEVVVQYIKEPMVYAASLWKSAQFGLDWNFVEVSRASGSNLTRRIEIMLDVKRHTKFSLVGRAMTGTAAATLLAISFALAIFARDKTEASKLPEARNQQQEVRNLSQGTGQTGQAEQRRDNAEPALADSRPTILYREAAIYTDEAKRNGLEGKVILDVLVAADGNITDVRIFSGLPDGLTESAIEAAKKVRFKPATRDGKPVSVREKMEIDFTLYKAGADSISKQDGGAASETMTGLLPTLTYRGRADYTQEAVEKKVEGDVLLSVIFGADSKIGAIRVVSGLPYGLTEEAIRAARAVRFEPAMKAGKPVSVRANLEIRFRL
jgi:TonB family protein